jgi:putative acetyltransferase
MPDVQRQGVGGVLIKAGLELLKASGVGLVFVLGHPEYYPRHGFQVAGCLGFDTPYHLDNEYAGAWMVQELSESLIGSVSGQVCPSEKLDRVEYW